MPLSARRLLPPAAHSCPNETRGKLFDKTAGQAADNALYTSWILLADSAARFSRGGMAPNAKAMENFSFIRRLSQFGTRFLTLLDGAKVGADADGNVYYRARKTPKGLREKRWVIYKGEPEASKVPPEWHIWLHHMANAPLEADSPCRKPWQKPHRQNLTGTRAAWRPPGHTLNGNNRQKATGDYQPWTPGETN